MSVVVRLGEDEPEEKQCPCGVIHNEPEPECPICQLEAERERSSAAIPSGSSQGDRA